MKIYSSQVTQYVQSTVQGQGTQATWLVTNTKARIALIILGGLLLLTAVLIVPWLLHRFTTDIIYVRPVAVGNGTGTSWAHATTLRDALQNRAHARDEIWIAAGIHYPILPQNLTTVTSDERDTSFVVRSRVALYGGFVGNETQRDQRNPATHQTVLSGDIDQNGMLDTGNTRNVVDLSGTNATTVLDGLTIMGGNSNTGGSGILNIGGSPNVTNVVIKGNTALDGGSVYNGDNGNPIFTNVTIRDNEGFGMMNKDSNSTFIDGTISNNRGRGVYIEGDSSASFINVTINENADHGVFIFRDGRVIFTNGVISSNGGKGVFNSSFAQSVFTNVHITDNDAGAIINNTDISFHNTSTTDN